MACSLECLSISETDILQSAKTEFSNENEFNTYVRENKAVSGPRRKSGLICKEKKIDFKHEQRFQT